MLKILKVPWLWWIAHIHDSILLTKPNIDDHGRISNNSPCQDKRHNFNK